MVRVAAFSKIFTKLKLLEMLSPRRSYIVSSVVGANTDRFAFHTNICVINCNTRMSTNSFFKLNQTNAKELQIKRKFNFPRKRIYLVATIIHSLIFHMNNFRLICEHTKLFAYIKYYNENRVPIGHINKLTVK